MTRPTAGPDGEVTHDGDHATLTFRQRLRHPVERVWAAITDPVELSRWYMMQAVVEARRGGTIEFRSAESGHHVSGTVLTWDPPRVLEYEWKMAPRPDMPAGEDAVVRWQLDTDGAGTRLTLTHRRVTSSTAAGIAPATHVLLERLEAMLDGREMPDMGRRFGEVRGRYAPARL